MSKKSFKAPGPGTALFEAGAFAAAAEKRARHKTRAPETLRFHFDDI